MFRQLTTASSTVAILLLAIAIGRSDEPPIADPDDSADKIEILNKQSEELQLLLNKQSEELKILAKKSKSADNVFNLKILQHTEEIAKLKEQLERLEEASYPRPSSTRVWEKSDYGRDIARQLFPELQSNEKGKPKKLPSSTPLETLGNASRRLGDPSQQGVTPPTDSQVGRGVNIKFPTDRDDTSKEPANASTTIRMFRVKHADPEIVIGIIHTLFFHQINQIQPSPDLQITTAIYGPKNLMIMKGPEHDLTMILELVKVLDQPLNEAGGEELGIKIKLD